MKQWKQHASLLTACMILTGNAAVCPDLFQHTSSDLFSSFSAFSEQVSALKTADNVFEELRFSPETSKLSCDGKTSAERTDFKVIDGKLMVSAAAVGITDAESAYLTPEQAAAQIGCEITEQNGETVLHAPFQTARLIVKSKSEVDPLGGTLAAGGFRDLSVIQYDSQAACYAAYLAYQNDSEILYTQPDRIYKTADYCSSAIPESEYSWGREAIGADSYLEWLHEEKTDLPEIIVSVIDTGIYAEHNWLKDRVLTDCAMSFDESGDGSCTDTIGHGTHCAGIVAQTTPENVKILPVKVISDKGWGSSLGIYCGIFYSIEQGADVISMSIGGKGDSPLEKEAVLAAKAKNIPCCTAAMNDAGNAYYGSLSGLEECVTISSVDRTKNLSTFSNYGSTVDFAAPGEIINSAVPGAPDATEEWSGTSMATPFAAAAFADLFSYDHSMSLDAMLSCLRYNATDLGDPGFDNSFGWGMINLRNFDFTVRECEPPTIYADGTPARSFIESEKPVEITMQPHDPDDEIYYTVDGTEPTIENGTLYTKPVFIEESVCLKAISVKNRTESSTVYTRLSICGQEVTNPLTIEDGVLIRYNGIMDSVDIAEMVSDDSLISVGDEAFADSRVTHVTLPESVTALGSRVFDKTEIRSVTAPGVTTVAASAFDGCEVLNTLKLGSLRSIGKNAFRSTYSVFGYVELDPALKVIPNGAFENSAINVECEWGNITEIGVRAFVGHEFSGPMDLRRLTKLGKSAFERSRLDALTLSDSLTELPENVFYNAVFHEITALGVTVIDKNAFCFDLDYNEFEESRLILDFSKITSLGKSAFSQRTLDNTLTFSVLTDIAPKAFENVACDEIILPQIQALNSAVLEGCRTKICVPNVERIYFDPMGEAFQDLGSKNAPILSYFALEAGSALKEIEGRALSVSAEYAKSNKADWERSVRFLSGPEDSVLREYAERFGIRYLNGSGLSAAEATRMYADLLPYESETFRILKIGAEDCSVQWSIVRDGKETVIESTDELSYEFCGDVPGSCILRASLIRDGESVESLDFSITVSDFITLTDDLLCEDGETLCINWNTLYAEHPDYLDNNGILFAVYHYTAPKSGFAYFGESPCSGKTVYFKEGIKHIVAGTDTADFDSVTVDKNDSFNIRFQMDFSDHTYQKYPVTTLRIRQRPFSELCSMGYGNPLETEIPDLFIVDQEYKALCGGGRICRMEQTDPYTGETSVVVLKRGTDYLDVPFCNPDDKCDYFNSPHDSDGISQYGASSVFGIGNYCGMRTFSLKSDEACMQMGILSKDTETEIRRTKHFRTVYGFTPEADGEYICYTSFSDDTIQSAKNTSFSSRFGTDSDFSVKAYCADGSLLPDQQQHEYSVIMQLQGGNTYYLMPGADSEIIGISETKNALNTIAAAACQTAISVGDPTPSLTVSDAEGNLLTLNKDYTLDDIGNSAHAGQIKRIIRGIGLYHGFMVVNVDVYDAIALNEEITIENTAHSAPCWNYHFTPDEDGEYTVFLLTGQSDAFMPAHTLHGGRLLLDSDTESAQKIGEYSCRTKQCKAGETIQIHVSDVTDPQILEIRKGAPKLLGELSVPRKKLVYSGKSVTTECTVTDYSGNILTEGTDYELLYFGNNRIGVMEVQARGIGEYAGSATALIELCCSVQADSDSLLIPAKTERTVLFTPESDGVYSFWTGMPEERAEEIIASGSFSSVDDSPNSAFSLRDESELLCDSTESLRLGSFIDKQHLKAGKDYYIHVENDSLTEPKALYVTKDKHHIGNLCVEAIPMFPDYTGLPIKPEFKVCNGDTLLKEGTDYRLRLMDNVNAGNMKAILNGIGDYCGIYIYYVDISSFSHYFELGDILQYTRESNAVFRFTLMIDTYLTAERISGRGANLTYEISAGWDSWKLGSDPQLIPAGSYMLIPEVTGTPYFENEPITFRVNQARLPLCFCDVRGGSAEYTGSAILPHFEVSYEEHILTEGVDYDVRYQGEICEPGRYQVQLVGKGNCSDETLGFFTVLPKQSETAEPLTDGTHTAVISAKGQPALFDWIPEQKNYCIRKEDLRNTELRIHNENCDTLYTLSGIDYQYQTIEVQPGSRYRISVSFRDNTLTGETAFTISSSGKMLDNCTLDIPETFIRKQNGECPAFTVKDGDTLLTEGKDYKTVLCGGTSHIGRCCLVLHGCGAYTGEKTVYFFSVPNSLTETADPQNSKMDRFSITPTEIPLDQTIIGYHGLHGYAACYTYTAEADGIYYLTLPTSEKDEISVFVYDGDDELLPSGTDRVTLNAGSTCSIFCVSNFFIEADIEPNQPYKLEVSQHPHPFSITADGITYRIEKNKAILTGTDGELLGLGLPDAITDPESGTIYPFGGIDAAAFADRIDSITFFCKADGTAAAYCQANGYCWAVSDGACDLPGDLTGDGIVDFADAMTLQRFVTEGSGVMFSESQLLAADVNKDGFIDTDDVMYLYAAAAKRCADKTEKNQGK